MLCWAKSRIYHLKSKTTTQHDLSADSIYLILAGTLGTIYLAVEGINRDSYAVPSMSYREVLDELEDVTGLVVLDVRIENEIKADPVEWTSTMKIPLRMLEKRSLELAPYRDAEILVLCPTGNRSRQGARILRMAGFEAYYLDGGLERAK